MKTTSQPLRPTQRILTCSKNLLIATQNGAASRAKQTNLPQPASKRNKKMNAEIEHRLRESFEFFVNKVFIDLHEEKLGHQPYIEYLCHEFEEVATGKTRRLV